MASLNEAFNLQIDTNKDKSLCMYCNNKWKIISYDGGHTKLCEQCAINTGRGHELPRMERNIKLTCMYCGSDKQELSSNNGAKTRICNKCLNNRVYNHGNNTSYNTVSNTSPYNYQIMNYQMDNNNNNNNYQKRQIYKFCPNSTNPYHTCSNYCVNKYGFRRNLKN